MAIQLAMIAVLFGGIAQANLSAEDTKIVELLRDAQATNLARVRAGSMTTTIEVINSDKNGEKTTTTLDADVLWNDDRTFWKWRGKGSDGLLRNDESQADSDDRLYYSEADKLYAYNRRLNTVMIKWARDALPPLLYLTPAQNWFACCPPTTGQGRPWVELMGPHPKFPAALIEKYEVIHPKSDGIVKFLKYHKSGGVGTVTCSLPLGGNVIATDFAATRPDSESTHGEYHWKKLGNAYVLESCTFTRSERGKPKTVRLSYQLHNRNVRLGPPSGLSTTAFIARLPRGAKVSDGINAGKGSEVLKIPKPKPNEQDEARERAELANKLKERGFLKKPPGP